jgi:hypothetical protein
MLVTQYSLLQDLLQGVYGKNRHNTDDVTMK